MAASMATSHEIGLPVYNRSTLPPPLFCEKNYKFIRVATDSICKVCSALFYITISLAVWIVSAKKSHHYRSLAYFNCDKVIPLLTYLMHGSKVVDFSINSFTHVKELLPTGMNEWDALKSLYGSETIDCWARLGTSDIHLNKTKLCRQEMGTDGCCFGMSLDFISSYLRQIKCVKSCFEAVKSIAHRYVDGAPDHAQLAQIFHQAFASDSEKTAREFWTRITCERLDEIGKRHISELKSLKCLDPKETAKLLPILSKQFEKSCKEVFLLSVNGIEEAVLQRHQIIANTFDLTLQKPIIYLVDKFNKNNTSCHSQKNLDFETFIEHLPQGAYAVTLHGSEKFDHAIAFVKTGEGQHFIYDPNRATFAIDSAADLWKIIRWGCVEDWSQCDFMPCALR